MRAVGNVFFSLVFIPILGGDKIKTAFSTLKHNVIECKCLQIVLESFPLMQHRYLFINHSFLRINVNLKKKITAWNFFIWPRNSIRVLMRTRNLFSWPNIDMKYQWDLTKTVWALNFLQSPKLYQFWVWKGSNSQTSSYSGPLKWFAWYTLID